MNRLTELRFDGRRERNLRSSRFDAVESKIVEEKAEETHKFVEVLREFKFKDKESLDFATFSSRIGR